MKRICLLLTAAVVMMTGCIKEDKGVDLKIGDKVPEFRVEMSDGNVVTDKSLEGSVSVIMFFHTTCPDCQKALPVMQKIYDEFLPKGVRFALVSRGEDDASISTYWENNGLGMPYSAQNDRSVYEKFATSRIPRIYVNDRNGIIRHIFADNPVPVYDELKSAVENILRSFPPLIRADMRGGFAECNY